MPQCSHREYLVRSDSFHGQIRKTGAIGDPPSEILAVPPVFSYLPSNTDSCTTTHVSRSMKRSHPFG